METNEGVDVLGRLRGELFVEAQQVRANEEGAFKQREVRWQP
jgi:hypothetical protein